MYHDGCWLDDCTLVVMDSRPSKDIDVELAVFDVAPMPQFNAYASDGAWLEYGALVQPQRWAAGSPDQKLPASPP